MAYDNTAICHLSEKSFDIVRVSLAAAPSGAAAASVAGGLLVATCRTYSVL
jgi:hypothetical protein